MNSIKGFKLLRLRLIGNEVFDDIDVCFFDCHDKPKELYTTLVIGPNGTGKSNLLRTIILLFDELNEFKQKGKRIGRVNGSFYLEYSIDGNTYKYFNLEFSDASLKVKSKDVKPQVALNDYPINNFSQIQIPESVIALSNTITDKFPTDIPNFSNYVYLGVKANASTARTTTFVRKTIDLLYNALEDEFVHSNMAKGLDFLNYGKSLYVSYSPRYKYIIFQDDLTEEVFQKFFTHFWLYTNRSEDSPPWSLGVFKRIKEEVPSKIPKLVRLCKKIKKHFQYEYEGSRAQYFEFNIFDNTFSREELHLIRDLHSLDLISYPSLVFQKREKYFDISASSSGEYHFISSFIGLLAKLTKNSLILIDEPENSLHPNWQMKYISFLKNVFRHFSDCHCIIASHSHLMVSDLNNSSSSIIGLQKEKAITATLIKSNTYGWSAEEVLLSVFNTPSNRNFYLTEQLTEIFKLVSEEPTKRNVVKIQNKVTELRRLDLSGLNKQDPLLHVLEALFKKFSNA